MSQPSTANGAQALIRTAASSGIEVCFTNPGTTEIHLIAALDSVRGVRAVLGLFEGVCTGAADGYGRMADRPAMTLLHLGPGFANGIANLHNAQRAHTPLVSVIGDHPTWHVARDAPLTSDIESLARPVSRWVRTCERPADVSSDMAEAVAAARSSPGGVASLVVPGDCAWGDSGPGTARVAVPPTLRVDAGRVSAVAEVLARDEPTILLIGGKGLREPALRVAGRLARDRNASLYAETFISRLERGAGRPPVERLPYFPEQVQQLLAGVAHIVLAGAREPVSFFGYPGSEGPLVPETVEVHTLASVEEDVVGALQDLADRVGCSSEPVPGSAPEQPERPSGSLDPTSLGAAIAAVQPEGAIVVDEAATSGGSYWYRSRGCPPHDVLGLTGGAIGQGLPCATGAAIACPDRPVIAFQADGSGMYTLQALWTQAREGLDVTTIICANREYRILRVELARARIAEPGPQATAATLLQDPSLDWTALARGMGVPGVRVDTADALLTEMERAIHEPGPHLIEAVI